MTFDQFLRIIRARWKLALSIFVLAVLGTVIGSLVFPKKYAATATVIVDSRPDAVSSPSAFAPNASNMAFLATQIDVIQSPRVAMQVVRDMRLADSAQLRANWIKDTKERGSYEAWVAELIGKGLKVRPSRESSVIDIEYEGADPLFSASMANAYAKAFIDTSVQFRVNPARQFSDFFEDRARLAREKLERAQQALAEAQKAKGIIATEERLDVETLRLNDLAQQVTSLRALKDDALSRSVETSRNPERATDVINNTLVSSLKSDLARAEVRLQELLEKYSDAYPTVIEQRASVAKLRSQVNQEISRVSGSLGTSSTITKTRESDAIAAYEAQREKLMKLKEARSELAVLEREVDSAQRIYEAIMARLSQSNLEGSTSQAGVTILSPATEPTTASSPKLLLNTAIAAVLGALLSVMAALGIELFDRRIRSSDDLVQLLDVAVIGALPGPAGKTSLLGRLRKSERASSNRPALA